MSIKDAIRQTANLLTPVRIVSDQEGTPLHVEICDKDMRVLATISAEAFERTGLALERMRNGVGDGRWCCYKCGYHEERECPTCEAERNAEAAP